MQAAGEVLHDHMQFEMAARTLPDAEMPLWRDTARLDVASEIVKDVGLLCMPQAFVDQLDVAVCKL
jgi:hypothetical protein